MFSHPHLLAAAAAAAGWPGGLGAAFGWWGSAWLPGRLLQTEWREGVENKQKPCSDDLLHPLAGVTVQEGGGASHLCIAVHLWRLAEVCQLRWGSGWSRAAGRWCRRSPQQDVRWADAGCRWIRWRWALRCWARRRWWCWLVENWGLLGGKNSLCYRMEGNKVNGAVLHYNHEGNTHMLHTQRSCCIPPLMQGHGCNIRLSRFPVCGDTFCRTKSTCEKWACGRRLCGTLLAHPAADDETAVQVQRKQ